MSHLIVWFLSPLTLALLLATLAFVLAMRGRRRAAWILAGVGFFILYVGSMPLTAGALRASLERAYPETLIDQLPTADAIVVLGGAIRSPDTMRRYASLDEGSSRLWHAARLYHAGKAPFIVASGGYDPALGDRPEAYAMAEFLEALGVPKDALRLETTSRTTRENARETAKLLGGGHSLRILLVTTASHMPRARATFEAQGFKVIPAAADYEGVPVRGWERWAPDAGALTGTGRALKEWVGRWALAVLG